MSKKVLFLISFVLLLSLVGSARAAVLTWDNNGGTGDRLWDTALNWDADAVPGPGDEVVIDDLYTDASNGPIIQTGIDAVCSNLGMGIDAAPSVEAVLSMTGGTLDVGGWVSFGDDMSGNYRFDLSGGTMTVGGHFYAAYDYSTVTTVNMTGGTINVGGYFDLSEQGQANCTFNMDGGEITIQGAMYLAYEEDANATFTITDGNLIINDDLWCATYGYGVGVFNMEGGNVIIGEDIELADYENSTGTINISGGAMEIADDIYLGWSQTRPALINMTGGTVTCISAFEGDPSWLEIAGQGGSGGGHLNMHGGTLSAYNISMSNTASMSITEGTLIFDADVTGANDNLWDPDTGDYDGTLISLASQGVITVYGTNHGDIITDDVNYPAVLGLRAVLTVDYGSRTPGKTTVTADTIDPDFAWNPRPVPGSSGPPPAELSWEAGATATAHQIYLGTSFNDVDNANTGSPEYMGEQVLADVNYPLTGLLWGTDYYWRIDEVSGGTPLKGQVWSFTVIPAWAIEPVPEDGAEGVSPLVILSWTPGPEADTHQLYLSTDFGDVNERLMTPETPGANTYDPGPLEFDTTYYWAVDEVNLAADVTTWYGEAWSFTTDNHLVVDNFESYVIYVNEIFDTWLDYHNITTGAILEINTDEAFARDGNSMLFEYNNTRRLTGNVYGSWADANTVNLLAGSDWTIGGAKALRIDFYGDPGNSATVNDKMYVALNDGTNVHSSYYPDVNDINDGEWYEWHIDLEDFNAAGVDLKNILGISIGFGTYKGSTSPGGTGTVYFDDIELWPPYCRSEFFPADITGDCIADGYDLQVMSADWLLQDYNYIAAEPCEANLIGLWKFDEGTGTFTEDSSIYDNDGNIIQASWTTGYPGDPFDSALAFDGDGVVTLDHVIIAEREGNTPGIYPAELMPSNAFTIVCWTKLDSFDYFEGMVSNVQDTGADECGFALYNGGWMGETGNDFGFMLRTQAGGMNYIESDGFYDTGVWYHVAGTYDGTEARLYVDGMLATAPVDVGGPMLWESAVNGDYPQVFAIGKYEDDNENHYVKGTIDDVRFYNYGLSQGEIRLLVEAIPPGTDLYQPVPSLANLADPEPQLSRKVNFVDYAILADKWLTEQFWP